MFQPSAGNGCPGHSLGSHTHLPPVTAPPTWVPPATGVTESTGRGWAKAVAGLAWGREEIAVDVRLVSRWRTVGLQEACEAVGNLMTLGLELKICPQSTESAHTY